MGSGTLIRRFGIVFIFSLFLIGIPTAGASDRFIAIKVLESSQMSELPPAFLGNHISYALALFALLAIIMLAARYVVITVGYMARFREPWSSPITINRMVLLSLLITILLQQIPNTVIMLAWGEVSMASIRGLMIADKTMDALSIVPFGYFIYQMLRGETLLHEQLLREPIRNDLFPTLASVGHHIGMITLVVLIALGVTVGK